MRKKRRILAEQIFADYERFENRLPSRVEFNMEFYGYDPGQSSRYYYAVKRKYLQEKGE